MSTARRLASRSRRFLLGVRPKDTEPYATHLPVLMAIARLSRITRVLELGSGPFSTGLFLNREAFPDLELLTSFEDDSDWVHATSQHAAKDPRLDFRFVTSVRASVPDDLTAYDLIFIDDSRTVAERSSTLISVGERRPPGLVAMHDYEQRGYRAATRQSGLTRQFVFRAFTPQVGLLGTREVIPSSSLRRAEQILLQGRQDRVSVTDHPAWLNRLAAL